MKMKVRRVIDLSHTIMEGMPVYPGDPIPKIVPFSNVKEKVSSLSKITLGSHTGTHIDAPRHAIESGVSVDGVSLEKLMGEAVVLDLSHVEPGEAITFSDLQQHEVKEDDIVLLFTGMGRRWGDEKFLTNYPYLSLDATEWLVKRGTKAVGVDWTSIEKYGGKEHPAHDKLLSHNIPVIESLVNLDVVKGTRIFFICLPLKLKDTDGAPARALAIEFET